MEYRRPRALSKRQSAHPATRASALSVVVFLLVCGLVIFIFCTSQAATWLVENVFEPIFTSSERAQDQKIVSALQSQDKSTPLPSVTPQATYSSATAMLDKKNFYLLQMGSFEEEAQAAEKAAAIRLLGAAGYVYPDGKLYRVFAACYENAADLTKVQDQIRTDGFENTAYILRTDAIKIAMSGKDDDVKRMEAAADWLETLPALLTEYVITFDRDGMSVDQGILQVRQWQQDTEAICGELESLKTLETVQPILSALQDYGTFISTFLQLDGTMDLITFSASLKALQIQTIVRYCAITGQETGLS